MGIDLVDVHRTLRTFGDGSAEAFDCHRTRRNADGNQAPALTGIECPLLCGAVAHGEVDVQGFRRISFGKEGQTVGAGTLERYIGRVYDGTRIRKGRAACIGQLQRARTIAHMIQRVCYLGSAGDSAVIGSDDVLGIAFKLIQHSRHLANCDGDRRAPAIVTDHDFARGARCARSGEHTGLGDGTYIIGDAPLEQLIGFIKKVKENALLHLY